MEESTTTQNSQHLAQEMERRLSMSKAVAETIKSGSSNAGNPLLQQIAFGMWKNRLLLFNFSFHGKRHTHHLCGLLVSHNTQ